MSRSRPAPIPTDIVVPVSVVARRPPGRLVQRHPGALPGPGGAARGHGRPRHPGGETPSRGRRGHAEASGSLALPCRSPGPIRVGHPHGHYPSGPRRLGAGRRRHPGEPALVGDEHSAQAARLLEERTAHPGDAHSEPYPGQSTSAPPCSSNRGAKKLACGLAQLLADEPLRHRLSANALALSGHYSPAAFVAGVGRAYGHLAVGAEGGIPTFLPPERWEAGDESGRHRAAGFIGSHLSEALLDGGWT